MISMSKLEKYVGMLCLPILRKGFMSLTEKPGNNIHIRNTREACVADIAKAFGCRVNILFRFPLSLSGI